MDKARLAAQVVVTAGLVFVWPGPRLASMAGSAVVRGLSFVEWVSVPSPGLHTGGSWGGAGASGSVGAGSWFQGVRASCNPVEVEIALRGSPAPDGFDGTAYEAACRALAGQIGKVRSIITGLPADDQWRAAGVVFETAHPVADAGDDLSAGPIMELVVEFWPNHYMALYHAGAARFALDDFESARNYLEEFLRYYEPEDGWRRDALGMLEQIGSR